LKASYRTQYGLMYCASIENFLKTTQGRNCKGKVQLLFTSPPFPLNRKKRYGNKTGEEYLQWMADFGPIFRDLLTPTGSIVIEVGNAWESGSPTMSTLALRSLLGFLDRGRLHLCQQFICHNPARLPTPAQWVTIERIRVKDSFTHVWWMSATERPKANNRNVLTEYSAAMKQLLKRQKYNAGTRPSQHVIKDTSFLTHNAGAIPPSVLTLANTRSNSPYQEYCRENDLPLHPARMPIGLADFFIKFLTDPGDLVLDPFGGSNTTGQAAEERNRKWISVERMDQYVAASRGRFKKFNLDGPARGTLHE